MKKLISAVLVSTMVSVSTPVVASNWTLVSSEFRGNYYVCTYRNVYGELMQRMFQGSCPWSVN